MLSTVAPIPGKQLQVSLRPLHQMVQMLQRDFGVGVPAGFVSLILGTICIRCNVSFKSSLWRFLCNSKDIYVYLWS
jgi:hypothetical protein